MAKYLYPAVFTPDGGQYTVTFPDWDGATYGNNVNHAFMMAEDFLNFTCWNAEQEHGEFKDPTPLDRIKVPEGGFVNLIPVDTVAYQEVIDRENNPITYARKKAGLSIKELADLLKAPYRTVQDWNAGRRMPPKWVQDLVIDKIKFAS